jgi:Holliday junction resolvase RusA-like endonuclease
MINFTIRGAVPSKSNCYRIIKINKHGSLAKSKGLKVYEKMFFLQVPDYTRGLLLTGLLKAKIAVYYTSNRLDLDNSAKILLDCLQASKVIKNDNQIVDLHMTKHIDRDNPRAEIHISEEI